MLRHIIEWFKDNVGLAILIGIVSIIVLVYGSAKRIGFTANLKIINANQELIDSSYEKYNGIDLKGSEVINAIKRYQDVIHVTVCTGGSVDTYSGDFKSANNDRKSEKYIKPSQNYTGSLLRDNDKEAIGLLFTKEGIVFSEASYKELLAKIIGVNPEDSTMDSIVKQIDELVKNNNATIAALQQNISSLNTNVSTLSNNLTTANNNYNTLLGEVDAGKELIASAISKKGVTTSATDSFSNMADNVGKIASEGLASEEYIYSNQELSKKGSGIKVSVQAKNVIPEIVVISSHMGIFGAYNSFSNYGTLTITSTKYSSGGYAIPRLGQGWTYGGSIILSDNSIEINISPNNVYTGWLSVTNNETETTKITIYGTRK